MKADFLESGVGAIEDADGAALFLLILNEEVDTLVRRKKTDDFGVEPRNGLELARPVFGIVRPCKPSGLVRLPLRSHSVADLSWCLRGHVYSPSPKPGSRKRLVIGV